MLAQRIVPINSSIVNLSSTNAACPKCGTEIAADAAEAQSRIQNLEAQVRALNSKAAAAVDKLADYEDEVRALRAQCTKLQQESQTYKPSTPGVSQTTEPNASPSQARGNGMLLNSPMRSASRLATLSSFFTSRQRETGATTTPTSAYPPPSATASPFTQSASTPSVTSPFEPDSAVTAPTDVNTPPPLPTRPDAAVNVQVLQSSLESERSRRLQAETSLTQTQTELEELTAQLFGQANEMVAAERKARFRLEERVKMLEDRDGEKRRRLERLEKALQRIERVRGLVERRNTVNGIMDSKERSRLDEAESGSDVEGEQLNRGGEIKVIVDDGSGISQGNDDLSKTDLPAQSMQIKRKPPGGGGGITIRDMDVNKDRDRLKIERKGTV